MSDDQEGDDLHTSESTGDPELDRQVADLEQKRDKVAQRIEETRSDWKAKEDDPAVPGAMADPTARDDEGQPSDAVEEDSADQDEEPYDWVDPEATGEDDGSDDEPDDD